MKAIRFYRYGAPEVLQVQDVDLPAVGDEDVLIRVHAASVNPLDFHYLRGTPYVLRASAGLTRPKVSGLGADFAGVVEAVGANVTRFRPGDEVFGASAGTFAEYLRVRQDRVVVAKPAEVTFEQAAAVPVAGFTALQALRDKGNIQSGQHVLVNGAAGGVGTFAVQLAKALGAEVTGVCSTGNVAMVGSIGADHVVDYTREDFTRTGQRYDLMIDIAGNRRLSEVRQVLASKATVVGVGGPNKGLWIRPLLGPVKLLLYGAVVSQRMVPVLARQSRDDLGVLRDLLAAGKLTPVVDRSYPLSEVPDAVRYLETGHARGKVVITV